MSSPRRVQVTAWTKASTDAVWSVLGDPRGYAEWVSGTRRIRRVDDRWPEPGATLAHCWGIRPLLICDHTTVVGCDPGRRLELRAHVRPLAVVAVIVELEPYAGGTSVLLTEAFERGLACALPRLSAAVQRWRNGRSLCGLIARAEAVASELDA